MKKWILYNFLMVWAVYWASNLILWFPWSYSPVLGMVLMLTVSPVLWGAALYKVFVHFPGKSIGQGVLIMSLIFFGMSVILDYIFFGHFRNAMEELYHPTTFYGYAFVLFLPALIYLTFRRKIEASRRDLMKKDFRFVIVLGQLCFIGLLFVILME